MAVELRPIMQPEAFAFVREHHRHHSVPVGALWWHAAHDSFGRLAGVAIVGRPVARLLDDGLTCEVTRLCTNGADNACSLLYGAARRTADNKGYRRGLTYILDEEFQHTRGASLRAAGYVYLGKTGGGSWDRPSRRRPNNTPDQPKHKFGWGAWPASEIVGLSNAA
jgi:hypothetical protein